MNNLSHYDDAGEARMVDITAKTETLRTARATAMVKLAPAVLAALESNPKGDPLQVARIAGIMAAKKTPELIPMCHSLLLKHVDVRAETTAEGIRLESEVSTLGATGVEMEALTAVTVAALTVYDMTKALDKGIEIAEIRLLEKTGGKSGDWRRP